MADDADDEAAISAVIAGVTPAQWGRLRSLAEQLRADPGSAGEWTGIEQHDDGTLTLPYFVSEESLNELVRLLYDAELVTGVFDWPKWWSTCRYHEGAHIELAPATDLVRIITSVVRGDRFSEGALARYVANGALPSAVLRLAALATDEAASHDE